MKVTFHALLNAYYFVNGDLLAGQAVGKIRAKMSAIQLAQ